MKFEVQASSHFGIGCKWSAQTEHLPPIECAIPPEFEGPGGGYSPEELFAIALLNCLIATFKVFSEKAKESFQEIHTRAILTMDRVPENSGFAITQAEIFFDIKSPSDEQKIRKLLEKAIKECAISNSIKTGKTFHINFS